ncbi:MAG: c-type cytochrome [Rhodocyclaceae bacterium]|nr:MAG: c-type cytochrome [Rhodocyclaceae bacterium]
MLNSLVLLTVTTAFTSIAHASLPLAQKGGCMACHGVDKKIVGPAYKDVADKYKGQKDAVAKLMEKVRKGGSGAWGTMAMPATGPDKLNDADLKAVIEWVLKGAT